MNNAKEILTQAVADLELEIEHIDSQKKRKFLKAVLITGGNLKRAADYVKQDLSTHYKWQTDEQYMAVFKKTLERSTDILESEAINRAIEGEVEDVYFEGEVVGTRLRKSDNLLMFLLKERKPTYKDSFNPAMFNTGSYAITFNIPRPPVPVLTNDIEVDYEVKE